MSQEKQGWFVGVSPYFLGAEIKTTENFYTTYRKAQNLWRLQLKAIDNHRRKCYDFGYLIVVNNDMDT